jgi:hypothetical protein
MISFLALCLFALSSFAEAQFNYSGSISLNGSSDGYLQGTGDWNDMGPTSLSWDVSWSGSGLVHYSYTFDVAHHDISHLSLELSDTFTASDISNVTINGNSTSNYSLGSFTGGNVPFNTMPGDMYGIKFSVPSGSLTATITFDSTRLPEWGDFYARCGVRLEHTLDPSDPNWKQWNSAWNTGFATGETAGAGNDPSVATGSGSYQNHILTPNSVAVVPEPVSSMLFVVGSVFLAGRRLIKKKK